jgi:hypothetical protein
MCFRAGGVRAESTVFEGEAAADRVAAWFVERWGSASATTVNARLNALASAGGGIRAGSPRTRCIDVIPASI